MEGLAAEVSVAGVRLKQSSQIFHVRGEEDVRMLDKREARAGVQQWAGKGTCLCWRHVLVNLVLTQEAVSWVPLPVLSSSCCCQSKVI